MKLGLYPQVIIMALVIYYFKVPVLSSLVLNLPKTIGQKYSLRTSFLFVGSNIYYVFVTINLSLD